MVGTNNIFTKSADNKAKLFFKRSARWSILSFLCFFMKFTATSTISFRIKKWKRNATFAIVERNFGTKKKRNLNFSNKLAKKKCKFQIFVILDRKRESILLKKSRHLITHYDWNELKLSSKYKFVLLTKKTKKLKHSAINPLQILMVLVCNAFTTFGSIKVIFKIAYHGYSTGGPRSTSGPPKP